MALSIFRAESSLRCNAVGDGHLQFKKDGIEYGASYGVAQIRYLPGRPTPEQLINCLFNIQYAYEIYKAQGNWSAWSAYTNNNYKKFLN